MKTVITFILLTALSLTGWSQVSVIVNPDGSHSTLHQTGNSNVLVNPDGTHTVVVPHNETTSVVVNPDGSHSLWIKHSDAVTVQVNPDGSHSIIHRVIAGESKCAKLISKKEKKKCEKAEKKRRKMERKQHVRSKSEIL